jgi:hypothetical protein
MKNLKSKLMLFVVCATFLFSTQSCMTTKTQVGQFREKQGNEYVFDKGKQMWLFWGLIPIGRTSVNTPSDGACEVITKFRITDVIICGLTGGIVTSHSIKVKAKK